jgi:hypothetical protein
MKSIARAQLLLRTFLELKVEMALAYEANKPTRALSSSHKALRHHVSNESAAAAKRFYRIAVKRWLGAGGLCTANLTGDLY